MIDARFLDLMRCPIDGAKLANADSETVAQLNELIQADQLRDRQDQLISEPMDAALVTADQKRIYPVRGGIPTLIADEAIER